MDSWGITDKGMVRSLNQDVYKILIDEEKDTAVVVVCDGMGGANAGNIASELAAQIFTDYVSKQIESDTELDDIVLIVADAAVAANTAVFDRALYNEDYYGMGTTLTALVSAKAGEVVANIGDSRAYHITPTGITQITKDHSVVEDMIDRGEITREESRNHPQKNLITRAVGAAPYEETDIYTQNIDSGDIVLLCSDGLSNMVVEDEMQNELQKHGSLREGCESLLEMALSRGASDNVTIAVFRK